MKSGIRAMSSWGGSEGKSSYGEADMTWRMKQAHQYRWMAMALIVSLGLLLTGCGTGETDDDTAGTDDLSSARPTVEGPEMEVSEAGSPPVTNDNQSPEQAVGTPPESGAATAVSRANSTPVLGGGASGEAATPDQDPVGATRAPEDTLASPSPDDGATEGTVVSPSAGEPPVGDGTTGAPLPEETRATPGTSDTAEGASPEVTSTVSATQASAAGTPAATGELLIVDSCEIGEVPVFSGDTATYRVSTGLNFRSGPGSDCALIGDGPLGASTSVEVIGGPVVRQGEEGLEWVQVQVGGETGWVAFDFLEPAE